MKCSCGGERAVITKVSEEGVAYDALQCDTCGETVLSLDQARHLAKALEKIYNVSLSTWGESLALRIPASIARSLHLKPKQKARIIPDKNSFRVVPV